MERTEWSDARLDDLNKKVDEGFERMDKRFEQMDRRFDRMEGRFDRLQLTMLAGYAAVIAALIAAPQL